MNRKDEKTKIDCKGKATTIDTMCLSNLQRC